MTRDAERERRGDAEMGIRGENHPVTEAVTPLLNKEGSPEKKKMGPPIARQPLHIGQFCLGKLLVRDPIEIC